MSWGNLPPQLSSTAKLQSSPRSRNEHMIPVYFNVRPWNDGHLMSIKAPQPFSENHWYTYQWSWPSATDYIYSSYAEELGTSFLILKILLYILLIWVSKCPQVQNPPPIYQNGRKIPPDKTTVISGQGKIKTISSKE
jgi:hypothetical protein